MFRIMFGVSMVILCTALGFAFMSASPSFGALVLIMTALGLSVVWIFYLKGTFNNTFMTFISSLMIFANVVMLTSYASWDANLTFYEKSSGRLVQGAFLYPYQLLYLKKADLIKTSVVVDIRLEGSRGESARDPYAQRILTVRVVPRMYATWRLMSRGILLSRVTIAVNSPDQVDSAVAAEVRSQLQLGPDDIVIVGP